MTTSKCKNPADAQAKLRAKGWTLRPAARHLGVDHSHLYRVLSGSRHSASLLRRVEALPKRKETAR